MSANSSHDYDRLLELTEQACNGTLDGEDFIQLDGLLLSSRRNRLIYIEYVQLYMDIRHVVVVDNEDELVRFTNRAQSKRGFAKRLFGRIAIVSMPLFLMIALYSLHRHLNLNVEQVAVRKLPRSELMASIHPLSIGPKWKVNGKLQAPQVQRNQSVQVSNGCVELRFQNGTVVAIEGPSELVVENDSRVSFTAGTLRATLKKGASGFQVVTDAIEVIDRGTQFYVANLGQGAFTSYVSQGVCDIRSRNQTKAPTEFRSVTGGQCVLVDHERNLIPLESGLARNLTERMVSRFMTYDLGIRETSPSICLTLPPKATLNADFCSANRPIYVILEKQHHILAEELVLPGPNGVESRTLPVGTAVDSYLVHNAFGRKLPEGTSAQVSRELRTSGHVIFGQPIISVLWSQADLVRTDALFGERDAHYTNESVRELESQDRFSTSSSPVERISFDLHLSEGDYDQLRILVQSSTTRIQIDESLLTPEK